LGINSSVTKGKQAYPASSTLMGVVKEEVASTKVLINVTIM
jgi:hypothetical protein